MSWLFENNFYTLDAKQAGSHGEVRLLCKTSLYDKKTLYLPFTVETMQATETR
jgi:hypothetical protein